MLSFLDDFEGHPEQYIRREISVEPMDPSDDQSSTIVCWCYFYNAEIFRLAENDRVNAPSSAVIAPRATIVVHTSMRPMMSD